MSWSAIWSLSVVKLNNVGELLQDQGYQHLISDNIPRSSLDQVIISGDLRHCWQHYQPDGVRRDSATVDSSPTLGLDLYESNNILSPGWQMVFIQTRRSAADLYSWCSTPASAALRPDVWHRDVPAAVTELRLLYESASNGLD